MDDVFLVLAQAPGGLTCFVVPRVLPDGNRNRFDVVRLKDKLGNRSNASSELEFRRHLGAAARRRGPRRPHDHRDGRGHPARLRARLGLADAPRARGGLVARRAPLGLRRPARRQAADAERPRRPRRGVRGGDRARRCGWPLPSTTATTARGGAAPDRAAAGEVLGLQADADDGRRGAGVPGRQRLRRGVRHAAALPGVAVELDLGGLRQRQRPRRAAGAAREPESLDAWLVEVGRAGARTRAWTAAIDVDARDAGRPRRRRGGARRLAGRMAACLQGSLLVRSRRRRSPTPSAPRAWAPSTPAPSAPASPASIPRTIAERATPTIA